MNLVLRGLSLNDNPISQPIVGRFDERGGSIGRSDNATLTLPDPERMISRVQANVTFSDGGYWLVDVGSANPVVHNGQALGSGVTVRLKANDDLRIGGYRLAVEYEDGHSGATILRGRTTSQPRPLGEADAAGGAVRASNAGADNPCADLMAPQGSARQPETNATDPFADLLAPGPANAPLAASTPARVAAPASAADPFADLMRTPAQTPARLPDDFDPFADLSPQPVPAKAGSAADPFALIGTSGPSIDDAFGLNQPGGQDPLAGFLGPADGARAARSAEVALDPLVALGGAVPSASAQAALPDHVPELAGAYRPPQVRAASALLRSPPPPARAAARPSAVPQATPAGAPQSPQPSTYTADDIWRGFIEGVGVDIPLPRGVTPDLMRTVGVMLRHMIEGILQLMAVRAAAKSELRAAVTVIQVHDNNPLKFSPDVHAALLMLLQPPGRGFLPGPTAIREAMNDLQSHQIGVVAGMRAALAGLLARFEPRLLEGRLSTQSVLDTLLPMNRKAKLWELFLQHAAAIRGEAEDDFHELFGKAFIAAYEAQVEQLERAQGNAVAPAKVAPR